MLSLILWLVEFHELAGGSALISFLGKFMRWLQKSRRKYFIHFRVLVWFGWMETYVPFLINLGLYQDVNIIG